MIKLKKYIPIILSLIIIFGLLLLTLIDYSFVKKTKVKKNNVDFKTNIDKQLNKSEENLQNSIKRYNKINRLLKNIEQKTNTKLTNSNFDSGISDQPNKGLDRRLNIHINLDNPEERDATGM